MITPKAQELPQGKIPEKNKIYPAGRKKIKYIRPEKIIKNITKKIIIRTTPNSYPQLRGFMYLYCFYLEGDMDIRISRNWPAGIWNPESANQNLETGNQLLITGY